MENIEKSHLATWGLEPASPVSVNKHAIFHNGLEHSMSVD